MKAGVLRSDFLLNHLDWLRGCANLCLEEIRPVEVLLLQMWRKKLLFYSLCWTPRKGLYGSSRRLKPISLAKDLHQVLKPKKIGTSEVTDIAKLRVKHHPFRHCLWRFFTSNDDLQCALYIQSNIDYPTTSGQWPMDRCSDKGNVPDKEKVNVCTLYVLHIEGCRKLRLVMSLSYLYTHPYSPYKQYKHYKYDVLVMFCICTCTRTMASTLI